MSNPFGLGATSLTGTFAWTLLWQSTLWLALGLVVSRLWRSRAARAHLLLVLATVAAVASPLLTAGVRELGWGVLPAAPSRDVAELREADIPPLPVETPSQAPTEKPDLPISQEVPVEVERTAGTQFAESSPQPAVAESVVETTVPAQTARPSTLPLGNSL